MAQLPDIRLAPSGAPLGELPGNPFGGLQLRLVEAAFSVAALAVTSTEYQEIVGVHDEVLAVGLVSPQPDRRYKVNFTCQYRRNDSVTGVLRFRVSGSYDEGLTWFTLGGNAYAFDIQEHIWGPEQAVVNVPMTMGSALPVPVPPAGAPSLLVKAEVSSSGASAFSLPSPIAPGNVAWLSVAELQG